MNTFQRTCGDAASGFRVVASVSVQRERDRSFCWHECSSPRDLWWHCTFDAVHKCHCVGCSLFPYFGFPLSLTSFHFEHLSGFSLFVSFLNFCLSCPQTTTLLLEHGSSRLPRPFLFYFSCFASSPVALLALVSGSLLPM